MVSAGVRPVRRSSARIRASTSPIGSNTGAPRSVEVAPFCRLTKLARAPSTRGRRRAGSILRSASLAYCRLPAQTSPTFGRLSGDWRAHQDRHQQRQVGYQEQVGGQRNVRGGDLHDGRSEPRVRIPGMSLSRPKINHLSQLLVKALEKAGTVTFLKAENDVRLQIVKTLTDELKIEEVVDAEVRRKLASYSRKIVEGNREWDVMYQKLYEEEMKKRLGF
jgi:uncharacterized protein